MTIKYPEVQPKRDDLSAATIRSNMDYSAQLGLTEITEQNYEGSRDKPVAIICPGGTLRQNDDETENELVAALNERDDVYKIIAGSGHRLLNEGRLIAADAAVYNLPIGDYVSDTVPPRTDMTYYVASHCPSGVENNSPNIFAHLEKHDADVKLWHSYIEGTSYEDDDIAIGSGSGAFVGAAALMASLGHRKFEFFGCDGSTDYAVDIADLPEYVAALNEDTVAIELDGRVYTTHKAFWAQTEEMITFLSTYPELFDSVHFHGESLHAEIFNTGGAPRQDYRVIPKEQPPSQSTAAPSPEVS